MTEASLKLVLKNQGETYWLKVFGPCQLQALEGRRWLPLSGSVFCPQAGFPHSRGRWSPTLLASLGAAHDGRERGTFPHRCDMSSLAVWSPGLSLEIGWVWRGIPSFPPKPQEHRFCFQRRASCQAPKQKQLSFMATL